jgi:hypothetical protein
MDKEELLKNYEKERDKVIQKHREEFLLLEKRLDNTLNIMRKDFLLDLEKLCKPVEEVKKEVPQEDRDEIKLEPKKGDGEGKVQIKRGSKNAWNMSGKS